MFSVVDSRPLAFTASAKRFRDEHAMMWMYERETNLKLSRMRILRKKIMVQRMFWEWALSSFGPKRCQQLQLDPPWQAKQREVYVHQMRIMCVMMLAQEEVSETQIKVSRGLKASLSPWCT